MPGLVELEASLGSLDITVRVTAIAHSSAWVHVIPAILCQVQGASPVFGFRGDEPLLFLFRGGGAKYPKNTHGVWQKGMRTPDLIDCCLKSERRRRHCLHTQADLLSSMPPLSVDRISERPI